MEAVLKTVVPKGTGGSNPSLSEILVFIRVIGLCNNPITHIIKKFSGEVPERPKGTVC